MRTLLLVLLFATVHATIGCGGGGTTTATPGTPMPGGPTLATITPLYGLLPLAGRPKRRGLGRDRKRFDPVTELPRG